MFHDSTSYAKIAKMSIKDFNTLLQKDSNEAMKAFLRGLNGNNEGLSVMVNKLSDLDVGGVRGAQALSALAGNVEKLEQKQKIANQALIENVSALNEYNVKNNNVAATLDKIQKKIQGWFTSDSLVKYFETALNFIAKFIGATEDADGSVTKWKENLLFLFKILMIVTATVLSYKAAVQLASIWTNRNTAGTLLYNIVLKTQNVLTALGIVRTQLFAAAQMLLTGNVRGAIIALRQLNLVLGLSPWGAVIALIGACTAAYFAFRDETDKVITKQKILNDVRTKSEKSIAKEISQVEQLFAVAKNENLSKEQRIKAIEQLNKISPEYLGNLRLETIHTMEASKAIGAYIQMLRKQSTAKAFARKLDDIAEREVTAKNKKQSDYDDYANLWGVSSMVNSWLSSKESKLDVDSLDKLSGKDLENALSKYTKEARLSYKERRKEFEELKREKELTEKGYEEFLKANPDQLPGGNEDPISTPPIIPPDNKKKKGVDKAKREREKQLNDLKKHNEKLEKEIENNGKKIYQLVQDNEDAKVSIMEDGYDKDLKELQRTNEKKIQALQSQLHSEEKLQAFRDLIAKTEKEANTAESGKDKEKAALLRERIGLMASVYQQLLVENKGIQDNLVTSWEIYNTKLSTITEKGVNDRIIKIQKEFEERQKNDKSNFTFEISQLTNLEKAKEKIKQYFGDQVSVQELSRLKNINQAKKVLQREFNKEEVEDQKAHLEDLVRELNYMLNSSEWQGMDLTVLTEEQKEEQVKKIGELKEKIAELQALLGNTEEDKKPTGDGLLSSLGGSKDILGMSPEQWEKLFAQTDNLHDKLAKVIAVAQMMQNVFSSYYDLVNANEQEQLQNYEANVNRKKEALQQQLDQGYINQAQYDKKVTKLQKDLDKRKALAEYRAAKRKKQMDIASAISNTALAILNALTLQPFWVGLAMAVVAGAMGAMQIATISKQPLPDISGYESGFYGSGKMKVKRNQDGKIYDAAFGGESRSGLVDNPTVFLAGEGGKNFPEMIIDGRTLTRMRPDVKEAMYEDIARINGYEKGYYAQSGKENKPDPDSSDSGYYKELLFEMRRNNELLEEIKNQERISVLDASP